MLIVRELFLRGPCRFTDLRNGLPGVATNLLSARLKELEDVELITRYDAPPPVATALYELTSTGAELQPVLLALGLWGMRFMGEERSGDAFHAEWLAYAPAWFTEDAEPDAPPGTIQLVAGGAEAVLVLDGGRIDARVGHVDEPDLTVEGSPRAVLGLLTGKIDLKTARALGATVRGRRDLLRRLRPVTPTTAEPLP